uniref:Uncharacterized protein n=1 Tax=Anguilla anguilla TaxID=7936 RepID=A0A0E9UMH7_ANGAN
MPFGKGRIQRFQGKEPLSLSPVHLPHSPPFATVIK